jgi:GSH-dependent disulfide-bond oxidoreductase
MGQANHFVKYAPEDIPYGKKRYTDEVKRLFGVMEKQLGDRDFLTGHYSIADMACYPWIKLADFINIQLSDYPKVADWVARIAERPAVKKAYEVGDSIKGEQVMDEEARRQLFGTHPPQP